MACSDCSGSGTCRDDHAGFDTVSRGDSISGDASCEPSSDWDFVLGVNPQNGSTETYDEIEGSFKHIWLNSYFSNTPEDHINESCEDLLGPYNASPDAVEFYIRHPPSESNTEYQFADPRPNSNGSYKNFVMDSILAIISGVSSSTFVSAGAALLMNYIGSVGGASVEPYEPDPSREVIHWDIDFPSSADFPTDPCDSTGVRFDIEPGVNSGTHGLGTWVRYTFNAQEYLDGFECVCEADTISGYVTTTPWLSNSVDFVFNG